ncbi:MAG: hypothetical protein QM731_12475 [Chitinophagaceae bacterium]
MNHIIRLTLAAILITFISCTSPAPSFPASELHFQYLAGNIKSDSFHNYSLVGRTMGLENKYQRKYMHLILYTDSIVNDWLHRHPAAMVIPVTTIQFKIYKLRPSDTRDVQMTYCWIVDKNDTLNIDLVKSGSLLSWATLRPESLDQDSNGDKMPVSHADEKVIQHIPESDFKHFIEQVKAAKQVAREQQRGIFNHNPG